MWAHCVQSTSSKGCDHLKSLAVRIQVSYILFGMLQSSITLQWWATFRVPCDWRFNSKMLSRHIVLGCMPIHGTIQPGEKQVVTVRIRAGLPQTLYEVIYFEVDNLKPFPVSVQIEGIYTSVALSLPRSDIPCWLQRVNQARKNLGETGSNLIPHILHKESKSPRQGQGLLSV